MNKKELVNVVANETGLTKKDAKTAVDAVVDGIIAGLVEDSKVMLVGFGSFTVHERDARKARNPQTGEEIDVPAKNVPKFKASKTLKELLNV